ncbi:hypothetical protein GFL54_34875 [Rhizobium laguerreae]|uniref:hypothetical protein n=1 Tax=Rhizobium laguerreae TaxID=1076926 RepID=UPI00143F4552|nr:hypothetical protein [Rhizobium laguerreae]MBY3090203.1 hypothetical protein [Rhizobium laguerreae]NKM89304.1 hypothetical protein [Rhizobium laguerreae]NKN09757.1 hypothetical protein [Rhizobium laguerreae]
MITSTPSFSPAHAPLHEEDIVVCERVFAHVCRQHQIANELDREELASSIIYYYQTGVRSEGTLIRLLA